MSVSVSPQSNRTLMLDATARISYGRYRKIIRRNLECAEVACGMVIGRCKQSVIHC